MWGVGDVMKGEFQARTEVRWGNKSQLQEARSFTLLGGKEKTEAKGFREEPE